MAENVVSRLDREFIAKQEAQDWSDIVLPDDWFGRDEGVPPPWGWAREQARYQQPALNPSVLIATGLLVSFVAFIAGGLIGELRK